MLFHFHFALRSFVKIWSMRTTLITTISIFTIQLLSAQTFEWVKQIAGTSNEKINSLHVDESGNVYIAGGFQSADFDADPGIGVATPINQGGFDSYVAKYDNNGNFFWAKSMGGTSFDDQAWEVVTDASGNVYCTGQYSGTNNFDPGVSDFTATSNGGIDTYVIKFDPVGNFLWVKTFGGAGTVQAKAIEVKSDGNVLIVGSFQGAVDFEPGTTGAQYTTMGEDMFLCEFTPAGDLVYAHRFGGTNYLKGTSLATDDNDNILIGAHFGADSIDCDPGPGTFDIINYDGGSGLLISLDSNGDFNFAKQFFGDANASLSGYSECIIEAITTDSIGNIYTCGEILEVVNFDPGGSNATLYGAENGVFITKSDSLGNLIWAKALPHDYYMDAFDIAVDRLGRVYVTGAFPDTLDVDPGPGIVELASPGTAVNTFVIKLDTDGSFIFAHQFKGSQMNVGDAIAVDENYNIFTSGYFVGSTDFDLVTGPVELTSLSGLNPLDVYLQKYTQCTPSFLTITESACDAYTWIDANTYTNDTLTSYVFLLDQAGCDSLVRLDLTINTTPVNSVSQNSNVLIADANGVNYQWMDCSTNQPIVGETSQTLTATSNGQYAVIVENNGCADTSACVIVSDVGLADLETELLRVYPNPSNGTFEIDFDVQEQPYTVRIVDLSGKLVFEKTIESHPMIDTKVGAGTYLMHIENQDFRRVIRIVIQ